MPIGMKLYLVGKKVGAIVENRVKRGVSVGGGGERSGHKTCVQNHSARWPVTLPFQTPVREAAGQSLFPERAGGKG